MYASHNFLVRAQPNVKKNDFAQKCYFSNIISSLVNALNSEVIILSVMSKLFKRELKLNDKKICLEFIYYLFYATVCRL